MEWFNKEVIFIFNLFKRKNDTEHAVVEDNNQYRGQEAVTVLENARNSLREIEARLCATKDQALFSYLFSFISYYIYIIEFYAKNMDSIISVQELLMLKYIDMMKGILTNFDEQTITNVHRKELLETIATMNKKLYQTISNIQSQQQMNLNVDLKTIQDLIKSDF
ncbi:MAG: hypothetical protein ACOYVK_17985 [Bacillota bacterium]